MTKFDDKLDAKIQEKINIRRQLYEDIEKIKKSYNFVIECIYSNNYNRDICMGKYKEINAKWICKNNNNCEIKNRLKKIYDEIDNIDSEINKLKECKDRLSKNN